LTPRGGVAAVSAGRPMPNLSTRLHACLRLVDAVSALCEPLLMLAVPVSLRVGPCSRMATPTETVQYSARYRDSVGQPTAGMELQQAGWLVARRCSALARCTPPTARTHKHHCKHSSRVRLAGALQSQCWGLTALYWQRWLQDSRLAGAMGLAAAETASAQIAAAQP
jgi:hypothetical protein